MKKLLLAVAASIIGAGVTFANPTLIAWENDFSVLSKDGVTLDLQGNTPDEGGGITIGAKGLKLTRTGNFMGGASNAAITVIFEASNIAAAGTLGGIMYDTTQISAGRNEDGTISTYWTATKKSTSTQKLTDTGTHRLAFVCGNKLTTAKGFHAYADGEEWGTGTSPTASSANPITAVLVGGDNAGDSVMTGMKVSRIAVLDGEMTPAEVAAYVWPSARSDYYDLFKANFSGRVLSMSQRTGSTIGSYNLVAKLFDLTNRVETSKTYTGGDKTTDLPGYTGDTKQSTWNIYCRNTPPGYVAPGVVVRIPPCSPACTWKVELGFSPFSFGGLIMEEGAVGTKITGKMIGPGDPVQIFATSARPMEFGNMVGTPSFVILKEDILLNTPNGTVSFLGDVSIDIAEGRILNCLPDVTPPTVQLNASSQAKLTMHGAGKIKAKKVVAKGTVELDYSNLPVDRETPYIDGDLEIDASTTLTLPAALADGGTFQLCSGVLTAATRPASIWVGDTEVTDYILNGNEIALATTSWTGAAGDNNWSTAANWSNGVPGPGSVASLGADDKEIVTIESPDVFAGALVCSTYWLIDGKVSTTTIDFKNLTASARNGARVIRCEADAKPSFTAVNLGSKFRMVWNGDALVATLATVTDETLAYYSPWAYYAQNIYTWTSANLGASAKPFDAMLGANIGTTFAGTAWRIFCEGQTEYEPGAVFRVPTGSYSKQTWSISPLCFGALIIEPGANNFEISCGVDDGRYDYLGDKKDNVGETWNVIDESFALSHGTVRIGFYGVFNLSIAAGKTFTVKTQSPVVQPGATLKMHGAGTFKVENRATAPAGGGVLQAVANVTLDFSDLALDRATPFIDGDLKIDETTRLVFPAGLAENVAYPLCSGTLTAPTGTLLKKITIGDEEKLVFLSFTGNKAVYQLPGDVVARIGDKTYGTVQAAFDAADATSAIDVIADGTVTLSGDKTIKSLNTFGNVTVGGAGTFAVAGGALSVDDGKAVTVNTPFVVAGTVRKLGLGSVAFNGSVATNGVTAGDFAVQEGTADFDGAITGAMVRGCGTDVDNWPVITLKENCTVSAGALVSPVRYHKTAGDQDVKLYGKVVQNGAAYTYGTLGLMGPNGGAGTYVLNSGSLTTTGTLSLQYDLSGDTVRNGQMTFEMNGGELEVLDFNLCRTGTSDNDTYRGILVLNGGRFSAAGIRGTDNSKDGKWKAGWKNHKRVEFNGGTWNVSANGNTRLFDTNIVWVVASGDITFENVAGKTTVVPGCFEGMDSLTFAGAGTFDVSELEGAVGEFAVTAGKLQLGEDCLSAETTLRASGAGKFGLAFEGEKEVKTLYFNDSVRTRGRVYGFNDLGSTRFYSTDPCGSVRLLEGKDKQGLLLIVK